MDFRNSYPQLFRPLAYSQPSEQERVPLPPWWLIVRLLRLLLSSGCTTGILSEICGINSLAADTFDCLPTLSNGGRNVGVLDLLVDSSAKLAKGRLHKVALLVTGAEKDGVDGQQGPCGLCECEGRE